jgi:hypothetical protein
VLERAAQAETTSATPVTPPALDRARARRSESGAERGGADRQPRKAPGGAGKQALNDFEAMI